MRHEIVILNNNEEIMKDAVIRAERRMKAAFRRKDELALFDAFCDADDAYEVFRIRGAMLPYEPDHEKWFKYYLDVLEGRRVAAN